MSFIKQNCENLRRDHNFEVISVHPINQFHIEDLISSIPRDELYNEKWCEVRYECSICGDMRFVQLSETEADRERAKIQ